MTLTPRRCRWKWMRKNRTAKNWISANLKRIGISLRPQKLNRRHPPVEDRTQRRQREALAVAVERANDGHPRAGGFERVVMAEFAGEIKLRTCRDCVIQKIP